MNILNWKKAFLFLAIPALFFTSCGKDIEEQRAEFIAVYDAFETCDSGNLSYTFTVSASSTEEDKVLISNLYDFFGEIFEGTIDGTELTIPSQTIDGLTISGTGELDGNKLMISYSTNDNDGSDNCMVTGTKQ